MASQVKVAFHGVYPQKRRQRKRSCRRFRRCAGAVERIAEYRKIKRASPPALWVSGSSRAKTYAKGVAIREHTELQTLPKKAREYHRNRYAVQHISVRLLLRGRYSVS